MKVLAVLLVCAFAAVHGRSTAVEPVKSGRAVAALGDQPWVVHLRLAVSVSGHLETGVGSLISPEWVLTSAQTVENIRFVWIRYGAVNVINPTLVTEASSARVDPSNNLALISINRVVEATDFIAPIPLAGLTESPEAANFCGYGENDGAPGEQLSCFDVSLEQPDCSEHVIASSEDGKASKFDIGAPLVADGAQFAVLVDAGFYDNAGDFLLVANYLSWIQEETQIELNYELKTNNKCN